MGTTAIETAAAALAQLRSRFVGRTALIFATGPSLATLWSAERPILLPSIAVNDAWRIAPSADILHASDGHWWRHYQSAITFDGLRTGIDDGSGVPSGVFRLQPSGGSGFDPRLGFVRHGHNSGTAAIHLAAQLGAIRIVLVGFDAHGGHFFGDHPAGLRQEPADFARNVRMTALLAEALAPIGIELVNATPGSAHRLPGVDLEDICHGQ